MSNLRYLWVLFVFTACGASPAPPPGHEPTALAETKPATKVDAPPDLAAWLHVDKPERLVALMDRVAPAAPDASCAKGDPRACLKLTDPSAPVDIAYAPEDGRDDAQASAFSVHSLVAFRAAADKDFQVTESRPGRLSLVAKATTSAKKSAPVVCDVSAAEGSSHRVVCGNEEGVTRLGPWLLTSPRPATNDELARVEVYKKPLVALADKRLTGDTSMQRETRQLAHDFGGATLKLTGADGAGAPIALDIDVRMQDSRSRWTKVLLAPLDATGPIPETFARLPVDTTAAVYVPGGGPFVALLDPLFTELALDPAKAKPVLDEARAVLGRPMVCGYVVDLDDGRTALAKVRKAADKDRKNAEKGLNDALAGHVVCGVQEPAKAAEQLARNLIQLVPPSPDDTYAVRSGGSLGLPKGSFIVETTHRKATPKGPSAQTSTTLAVADGNTTWLVSADDASDVRRAAHLSSRLLADPKGAVTAFPVEPGTVLTGYVTTLLGAFFWDLAMHSFDEIDKTLATTTPGRLQIAMAQHVASPGGSVSLRLSTDVASLPTLALRASVLALPVALLIAAASASDSPTK